MFIVGFSAGIYLPAIMPLIREHFAEKDLGKTISIYDSAAPISIFAVPFIVLFLLNYFHWRGIFGILGVALLMIAILFSLNGDELKINQPRKTVFKGLITRKSLWVMATITAVAREPIWGSIISCPFISRKNCPSASDMPTPYWEYHDWVGLAWQSSVVFSSIDLT